MEIFTNPKVDWLAKKWIFLAISGFLALAGLISIMTRGLNLGVDFTGGTLVYVKFRQEPPLDQVRKALSDAGIKAEEVTRFDDLSENQVQIRMARIATEASEDLSLESNRVFQALKTQFDPQRAGGQQDLNNIARSTLSTQLQEMDPEQLRQKSSISDFAKHYTEVADRIIDYRTEQGGVIRNMSDLSAAGVPASVVKALEQKFYLGSFTLVSVESVGPKVGQELQTRARNAILFSLLGMLVYIAFRFRPIYGIAGVIALFHDVFITVGLFSITGKEISLNVVAALLTLVGYSINDTIVIFDRVRENLRLVRRADLATIINLSVNQTLNRTILTSGMTFLAVMALYLFGGEVLNGFSFALVVGIIIGCYSTLAIASPVVLWWQMYSDRKNNKAAKTATA
ncbi:MAG: protein translocase subunit SecF [Acidobacteria bacterium]|nr:MAG: protein translocase subunit SecF [Acidobacteriota bacterium]